MSKPVTPLPVEVIREKPSLATTVGALVAVLVFGHGAPALLLWWFFASWFPELGITWWALVLPVFAVRSLFSRYPLQWWREVEHGQVRR